MRSLTLRASFSISSARLLTSAGDSSLSLWSCCFRASTSPSNFCVSDSIRFCRSLLRVLACCSAIRVLRMSGEEPEASIDPIGIPPIGGGPILDGDVGEGMEGAIPPCRWPIASGVPTASKIAIPVNHTPLIWPPFFLTLRFDCIQSATSCMLEGI
jgi:hypothetical protein